jgi:Zn-dependent protease
VRFESGYLVLGRVRGAPLRIHWATPLGLFLLSGFRIVPGAWLGFPLVILLHELGHAVLAWTRGLRVVSVDVLAYGGVCRHTLGTPLDGSIVAWGGVLAQGLLAAIAFPLAAMLSPTGFLGELFYALTLGNAWMIVFNLLPIPPLDGAEAWKLFGRLGRRRGGPPRRGKARAPAWLGDDPAEGIVRSALEKARDEARTRRDDPS